MASIVLFSITTDEHGVGKIQGLMIEYCNETSTLLSWWFDQLFLNKLLQFNLGLIDCFSLQRRLSALSIGVNWIKIRSQSSLFGMSFYIFFPCILGYF